MPRTSFKFTNPVRPSFKLSGGSKREGVFIEKKLNRLNHPVRVIRVNYRVWEQAIALADGDALRIEVISPDEVLVHNKREWR